MMRRPVKRPEARTIAQLIRELNGLRDGYDWKHDQTMRLGLFIAERLVEIAEQRQPRTHATHAPSEWNQFFATGMKAGKAPAQIGEEWQERKVKRAS